MSEVAVAERSVVDVLRAARERISDPERWATGYFAFDAAGTPVEANAPAACRWCAVGAVLAETNQPYGYGGYQPPVAVSARRFLDQAGPVLSVNDEAGHQAVLELYDRAIALAEAEA